MDYSLNFYDPADVPPSPKAFIQYEENRRKETGAVTVNTLHISYHYYNIPYTYKIHAVSVLLSA